MFSLGFLHSHTNTHSHILMHPTKVGHWVVQCSDGGEATRKKRPSNFDVWSLDDDFRCYVRCVLFYRRNFFVCLFSFTLALCLRGLGFFVRLFVRVCVCARHPSFTLSNVMPLVNIVRLMLIYPSSVNTIFYVRSNAFFSLFLYFGFIVSARFGVVFCLIIGLRAYITHVLTE